MLEIPLTIDASFTVSALEVQISVTHPATEELLVALQNPVGTVVFLFQNPAQGGANLTGTIFRDDAATGVDAAQAPYSGIFQPEEAFATLDGTEAQGTWKILVFDVATGNTGTFDAWSLRVEGCEDVEGEGEGEGEGAEHTSADYAPANWQIELSELLRVIQFYNTGSFHCDVLGEDGFAPGSGDTTCAPHDTDYDPQNWIISLSELLRLIQFYNSGGYHACPEGEDGYCAGL